MRLEVLPSEIPCRKYQVCDPTWTEVCAFGPALVATHPIFTPANPKLEFGAFVLIVALLLLHTIIVPVRTTILANLGISLRTYVV
jgi:hypothetical protein